MLQAFFLLVFLALVIGHGTTSTSDPNDECEPPTVDELKNVIGKILEDGDGAALPTVELMNYTIVCRAVGKEKGMLRLVSVVVEYCTEDANCSTGTVTEQIEVECKGGTWDDDINVRGGTDNIRLESPTATLTTPGRDDCAFCLSPAKASDVGNTETPDPITHCIACDSSCNEPRTCTGGGSSCCCNFYSGSTCVEVCPKFSNNNFMCVDACPTFFTNNSDNKCVCQDGRIGLDCTELVHCDNLTDPENGRVEVKDTVFDTETSYTCNTGYTLIGVTSRRCLGTGNWSDTEPRCEVDCGVLSDPDNGKVIFSTTILGSRANYSCNDGYTPTKDLTRICERNGEWSGKEPTCTETDDDDDDKKPFPVGAVVGGIVAGVVFIGCIVGIVVLLVVVSKKNG